MKFSKRIESLFYNYFKSNKKNNFISKSNVFNSIEISNIDSFEVSSNTKNLNILKGNYLDYLIDFSSVNKNSKIGILNNANMYVRGGGYRLCQLAQEESLCYVSNLYKELSKFKLTYFLNWLNFSLYNSNSMFYSKDICIYKNKNLDFISDSLKIDVISASAVNRKFMLFKNELKIESVMYDRMKLIIESFIINNIKTIYLSPFGCGAYGNDLKAISYLFYKILITENYIKYFDNVNFICFKDEEYVIYKDVFLLN